MQLSPDAGADLTVSWGRWAPSDLGFARLHWRCARSAQWTETAYGYCHTERLLSQMAQANRAEPLTDVLAAWTAQLWHPPGQEPLGQSPAFYIDGHRKPVYTEALIPRGLVGRLSTVLGCRALVRLA